MAALDLGAAFYAPRPVTVYQSETSMRSSSTNGSASREVGAEPAVGGIPPHPLGDRDDLRLDQWERLT